MSAAPWRAKLQGSMQQNKELIFSKWFQLATVRPNNTPANRTVVFRGFLEGSDAITFITDRRTNKVAEVGHNSAAEACWYFTNSREQYRLSGNLTIVGHEHPSQELQDARTAAWRELSNNARAQFVWPQPGAPKDPSPRPPPPSGDQPPLPTFCLSVLHIHQVDYVQLFDQVRLVYSLDSCSGTWSEADVNP